MEQEQEIIPHHRESQHQVGAEPPIPVVRDLQLAMGHFAAECNTTGMRNNCSKSDAKILRRKRVEC